MLPRLLQQDTHPGARRDLWTGVADYWLSWYRWGHTTR